jgi:DnaK suppressor protein
MTEPDLAKYEVALQKLREALQAELDGNERESAPVKLEGVMGRISRMDAMQAQQMALAVKRQRQQRLTRISTALQRIEDREYGLCCRCEATIKEARLDAFPDAVLCIRCASTPKR